jgi:hypothetical protein
MSNEMNPQHRANMIAQARANGNARLTVRANALEAGWNMGFICPDYEILRSPNGNSEIQLAAYGTGRIKSAVMVDMTTKHLQIEEEVKGVKNAVEIITSWL